MSLDDILWHGGEGGGATFFLRCCGFADSGNDHSVLLQNKFLLLVLLHTAFIWRLRGRSGGYKLNYKYDA